MSGIRLKVQGIREKCEKYWKNSVTHYHSLPDFCNGKYLFYYKYGGKVMADTGVVDVLSYD